MDPSVREELCKYLARVLVSFQDQYLAHEQQDALSGLLCQVWLPKTMDSVHSVQLYTKGQPFFIAGSHGADFLALFRCLSCRYEFGTDEAKPRELGAPGRVYLYSKPEFSSNVQHMSSSDYHRQSSARLCSIQSCILFPVFDMRWPERALAVIEIVQNNDQMDFIMITEMILRNLMMYNLASCSLDDVRMMMGQSSESPKFQIVQDMNMMPEFAGDGPSLVDSHTNNTPMAGDIERGGNVKGFVFANDSKKLGTGLSTSCLRSLMKKKKIKTLPKRSMAKYEEDVNILLGKQQLGLHRVPSSRGIDSRWKRVQDMPCRSRVSEDSEGACPDGAFPIQSSRMGKVKFWSRKSSSNSIRISPSEDVQPATASPRNESWPEMESIQRQSVEGTQPVIENSGNSSGKFRSESDDWIGMIDPAMVELMMTEDFGTDFGDIGDLSSLP